jgi:hypothetical protein
MRLLLYGFLVYFSNPQSIEVISYSINQQGPAIIQAPSFSLLRGCVGTVWFESNMKPKHFPASLSSEHPHPPFCSPQDVATTSPLPHAHINNSQGQPPTADWRHSASPVHLPPTSFCFFLSPDHPVAWKPKTLTPSSHHLPSLCHHLKFHKSQVPDV